MDNQLVAFEQKEVRRAELNGEMYFSVIDIVGILTESANPQSYWGQLKKREPHLLTICQKVKFKGMDGKNYPSDAANTEGVFRIIMSVPSPKAEPLKLWLAEQGKRTLDETENPELLTERQAELYRAKGYSDEWIDVRLKSIDIRKKLTDEWKDRGVKEGIEYSILTAEISKATFGMTPSEYQKFKKLERHNVRDHMSDLELIFTMLGEGLTNKLAIDEDKGLMKIQELLKKVGKQQGTH